MLHHPGNLYHVVDGKAVITIVVGRELTPWKQCTLDFDLVLHLQQPIGQLEIGDRQNMCEQLL